MNELAIWRDFGLAGLVIGALFAALILLGRHAINKFEGLDGKHSKDLEAVLGRHEIERQLLQEERIQRETEYRHDLQLLRSDYRSDTEKLQATLDGNVQKLAETLSHACGGGGQYGR